MYDPASCRLETSGLKQRKERKERELNHESFPNILSGLHVTGYLTKSNLNSKEFYCFITFLPKNLYIDSSRVIMRLDNAKISAFAVFWLFLTVAMQLPQL